MTKMIAPPSLTKLPTIKCSYGCPIQTAGWAWTWHDNKAGSLVYTAHPVCASCGTSFIKVVKGEKQVIAKEIEVQVGGE